MAKINGTVNASEVEANNDEGDDTVTRKHRYSLPAFRYTNIFITLMIIDGVLSCILWLTGGHSKYFVDNITNFHFKESVFDLALLAGFKTVIVVIFLPLLENKSYEQIDNPYNRSLETKCVIIDTFLKVLFLGSLAFTITKGGIILHCILNDDNCVTMHVTYNALVISSVSFSLLEFLLSLFSGRSMRRLKIVRILHRFNDKGQEIDKEGKPIKKKVDIKRLVKLAKPEWGILAGGSCGLLVSSAAQTAAPLFFGAVVDAAQKSMDELTSTVLTLLVIYIVYAIFAVIRAWLFTLAGQRLVARLRKHLFNHIIQQDVAFFDTNRTGELCNRLASDTQVVQNAATVNVSMLVRYTLQMVGSLVLMFYLNAALTGVLLAVVPIVSIVAVQYGKFVKKMRQKFQDRLADAGTLAEENISSIRTVRSFAGENKASSLYGDEIQKSYEVGKKLAVAYGAFEGLVGLLAYGAIAMVLWYGGKLVYDNTHGENTGLTPGVLTSFLLYTLQVAMAFALMSALYGDFMQAVGASIRIFDLLDRIPDVPTENGDVLYQLDGRVEFQHVYFNYPSRPETKVLKDITFTVEPGEMVALVGPSGGGKSTIVNLIERFYDPDSGKILLGDVDLKTLDPQWFRKKIAMVGQEPTLFASSIKDNIAYGCSATDYQIEEVAKEANAHEFISTFEEGYNTLVGERGVRLSGGQKQRIAIARALIMNPVLLLLDEATSALDAESEHLVQEAVDRAMKGRTVIVIAHRLSTVRNATKVVVIDKGEIAEMGTHDDLIAKNGVYKRLVLRQLTAGSFHESLDKDNNQE